MALNLNGGPLSSNEQVVNDATGNATPLWLSATGATIAGTKTNLGVQLTVQNNSAAAGQTAGIQFATGASNVALRTNTGGNWLELVDSGGTVRAGWRGGTYTVEALVVTGTSVTFSGIANRPASGTADLVINSSGGIGTKLSSLRFKENVEPLKDDFHKILTLEPKSFSYRDSGDEGIGYMAEDLDDAKLGRLVSYDSDGKPLSIDYKMMSIYLLEVLKEHQQVIKELRREIVDIKEMMH
jgi:hypothetical protein